MQIAFGGWVDGLLAVMGVWFDLWTRPVCRDESGLAGLEFRFSDECRGYK